MMRTGSIAQKLLFGVMLALLVSACGFQLRGHYALPEGMDKVMVQGQSDGLLKRYLVQSLSRSGVLVSKRPDDATAVISIHQESRDRRVLSVGDNARVREYESLYKLVYSVYLKSGKLLIDRDTILLSRDYSFNESDILGKEREETTLQHDMQKQAAETILRRLAYLK